jgi:predicted dehydrogenase
MSEKMTRREFVQKAAVGTAGLAFAGSGLLAPARAYGANDKISIGIIGIGQRCRDLMNDLRKQSDKQNVEVTAVCDIWAKNLDRAAKTVTDWYGKEPRKYRFYEDLLAQKDIDAVIIATADFQHAHMLADAVKAGKDVYCEKPFANDLGDARKAVDAVAQSGRIVQIGTQRRSEGSWAAAAELIASGVLGTISKVDCEWSYFGPRWKRNDVDQVKESDVKWKRFLIAKKYRAFDPHQFMEWRLYRDFSGGIPDQWMSHMIDVVHWMTGEQYPTSAVSHGGVYVWKDGRENEDTFQTLLEYPKGFLVSYATKFGNTAGDRTIICGTNGTLDCDTWKITPNGGGGSGKLKEEIVVKPKPSVNHMGNWLECLRSRQQPNATAQDGYSHAVAIIMATRALRTGKKVFYDPATREMREV